MNGQGHEEVNAGLSMSSRVELSLREVRCIDLLSDLLPQSNFRVPGLASFMPTREWSSIKVTIGKSCKVETSKHMTDLSCVSLGSREWSHTDARSLHKVCRCSDGSYAVNLVCNAGQD